MATLSITRSGVTDPKNAVSFPYDDVHITDFMDVWPHYGPAFGLDHLIYEDGEVEFRIKGYRLSEFPPESVE